MSIEVQSEILTHRLLSWGGQASLAQLVEPPPCKRKVFGSSPKAGSILMERFPSGQWEQTVNLSPMASQVRILPSPPTRRIVLLTPRGREDLDVRLTSKLAARRCSAP